MEAPTLMRKAGETLSLKCKVSSTEDLVIQGIIIQSGYVNPDALAQYFPRSFTTIDF